MKIKPEQLNAFLQKGLQAKQLPPIFVVSGDEPLLSQEATDDIRSAARQLGYNERETFDIDGRFDWNHVFNETNSLSLFADKKILELPMASQAIKAARHFVSSVKILMIPT